MPIVDDHAKLRALSERGTWSSSLGAQFVFVRLDERGGHDETVPWAFGKDPNASVVNWRKKPRDDSGVNMNTIREALAEVTPASDTDVTATHASPPPLVPPARGAASVYLAPTAKTFVVGRADAELTIAERSVSREHARLTRDDDDGFRVDDLNSSNGCKKNGFAVKSKASFAVRSGDLLELGDVQLLLLSADDYWVRLPELAD